MPRMIIVGALLLVWITIPAADRAFAAELPRASAGEPRLAQLESPPRVVRERPRIEVYPGRPLHRECVDGYREVWRPYWGTTVVTPYMRCRWVRG